MLLAALRIRKKKSVQPAAPAPAVAPAPVAEEPEAPKEEPKEQPKEQAVKEEAVKEEAVKEESVAAPAAAAPPPAEQAPIKAAAPAPAPERAIIEQDVEVVAQEEVEVEESELLSGSAIEYDEAGMDVLLVESIPPGAKVFVDGEEFGVTPLEIMDLADAPHDVILYHQDFGAITQNVKSGVGRIFVNLEKTGSAGAGFVLVETEPADVRIDIDGKYMGMSPIRLPVAAGRHMIVLSRTAHNEQEFSIEVEADETLEVKRTLTPKDGSLLIIASPQGAQVFFNGQSVGEAAGPIRIVDVSAGLHEVRVEKDGYVTWKRDNVKVVSDRTETVLAALHPVRQETNVRIYTDPEGARIWLDGKEVGVAGPDGVGFLSTKGTHILRMELNPALRPGFRPLQISMAFNEDTIDMKDTPIKLPVIDEAFISAQKLFERGESEEAIAFLDRISPEQTSYPSSRAMMIEILEELGRVSEIPAEFEKLFTKPTYRKNPILNLSMGYWSMQAASKTKGSAASAFLIKGIEALDRCSEMVDYFPADERNVLALKAHYYTGIAAEVLFDLTGDKKYVKKGVQAWEMFFGRMETGEDTLGDEWIDKANKHQRNLLYMEKKLGG